MTTFFNIAKCPGKDYYEASRKSDNGDGRAYIWILKPEKDITSHTIKDATLQRIITPPNSQEIQQFKSSTGLTFLAKQKFVESPAPQSSIDDEDDYVSHLSPVLESCENFIPNTEDEEERPYKKQKNGFKKSKSKSALKKKKSKSKKSLKKKK
jgi:hypothetical protein